MATTYPLPASGNYDFTSVPTPEMSFNDFEDGTLQGWSNNANCTPTNTTVVASGGTHSLLCTSIAASDMSINLAQYPVLPLRSYILKYDARAATVSRATQFYVSWLDNTSTLIGSALAVPILTDYPGQWVSLAPVPQVYPAPINAAFASLRAYIYATAAANEQHYLDNIHFRLLTLNPTY